MKTRSKTLVFLLGVSTLGLLGRCTNESPIEPEIVYITDTIRVGDPGTIARLVKDNAELGNKVECYEEWFKKHRIPLDGSFIEEPFFVQYAPRCSD